MRKVVNSIHDSSELSLVWKNHYGYLKTNEWFRLKMTLYSNIEYFFFLVGGDKAREIDVEIYDYNGNISPTTIQSREGLTVVSFTPIFTGSYIMKTTLKSSSEEGDYVGILRAFGNQGD